jgi:hypothetical protein
MRVFALGMCFGMAQMHPTLHGVVREALPPVEIGYTRAKRLLRVRDPKSRAHRPDPEDPHRFDESAGQREVQSVDTGLHG